MNNSGALWPKVVLAGALVVLLAGLGQLFRARFAGGDVYPEYSSLRGDPLGTRVLHEALGRAGVEVSRNFRDVARADPGAGTIYLCGLEWSQLVLTDIEDVRALLASVRAGSRLVLGFIPQDAGDDGRLASAGPAESDREDGREKKKRTTAVALTREFGVDARWLPAGDPDSLEARRVGDTRLPEKFAWHSALAFEPMDNSWKRVYEVGRYAAVLERGYGAGSIVMLGDAYVVSNEAMARARQSALLAWLQGTHRRAVFDETHLGVVENSGIAALARRYGLAHAALGLVAVALLHLWRSGSSLVPPAGRDRAGLGDLAAGDAASGLVNLLRRTLPAGDFYAACLAEYKHGGPWRRLPPGTQQALDQLGATPGGERRAALDAVRAAHELLKRKL